MEYRLKRDLPFAKVDDGHKLIVGDKDCCLNDKDGFSHTLCLGHEKFSAATKRLIKEGWIEEVKPKEIWVNVYPEGYMATYNSREIADSMKSGNRIKCLHFREVIE